MHDFRSVTQAFLPVMRALHFLPEPNLAPATPSPTSLSLSTMLTPPQVTRRNLPHWRRSGAIYWVTFRLADSLPAERLAELHREKQAWLGRYPEPWTPGQRADYDTRFNERIQEWLDAGHGSCALAHLEVRACVRECLFRFDGQRLRVHAAVIMPNHVHALLEPLPLAVRDTGISACASDSGVQPIPQAGMPVPLLNQPSAQAGMPVSPPQPTYALSDLLRGIKGASARAANRFLGRTGAFWMDESYDRIVRDEVEYARFTRYLRANPINARLASDQFWLWPSESDTGTPACAFVSGISDTGIPACDSVSGIHPSPQARMPVPLSSPCPPPPTS